MPLIQQTPAARPDQMLQSVAVSLDVTNRGVTWGASLGVQTLLACQQRIIACLLALLRVPHGLDLRRTFRGTLERLHSMIMIMLMHAPYECLQLQHDAIARVRDNDMQKGHGHKVRDLIHTVVRAAYLHLHV